MIESFKEIEKLLIELDARLNLKINIYIIGGTVLLYHGLKPGTKDIDLVTDSKENFEELSNSIISAGFKAETPTKEYWRMNLNHIFTKADFRLDLFNKTVCSKFILTKGMKKRAQTILRKEKLQAHLCSKMLKRRYLSLQSND